MELQEFVQQSLVSIVRGIEGAAAALGESNAMVSPQHISRHKDIAIAYSPDDLERLPAGRPLQCVEFDVAVTAVEGAERKGGIGIMVGSVGIGGHGKSEASSSSHSRLKFTVPVVLPSAEQ